MSQLQDYLLYKDLLKQKTRKSKQQLHLCLCLETILPVKVSLVLPEEEVSLHQHYLAVLEKLRKKRKKNKKRRKLSLPKLLCLLVVVDPELKELN